MLATSSLPRRKENSPNTNSIRISEGADIQASETVSSPGSQPFAFVPASLVSLLLEQELKSKLNHPWIHGAGVNRTKTVSGSPSAREPV
jgi:hypothetical protein